MVRKGITTKIRGTEYTFTGAELSRARRRFAKNLKRDIAKAKKEAKKKRSWK